jgi:hypothetical protein
LEVVVVVVQNKGSGVYPSGTKEVYIIGEYAKEQIQNSVKIEATIGIGITTIITSYVLQGAANGTDMPNWAILVLGLLLLTFFAVRLLAYFRFIVEKEMYLREKKIDAEIQQNTLTIQIRKLEAEIKLKQAEV